MSKVINLNNQSVNIENIWVEVTCLNCGATFSTYLKSPSFSKNCRCRKATFYFTATAVKGSRVVLNITCQVGFETPVSIEPSDVEIVED